MKLAEQDASIIRLADVVEQPHAEDIVHRAVRQVDGESGSLQGPYLFHHTVRLAGAGDRQHVRGIVGADDHPVVLFRQQRPEASGAAGQVEHQVGLPRELQRVPGELDVAPVGKFPGEAVLMLLQVGLSMLAIILVRKVEVDRRIVHDGNSRIHETNGMNPAVKLGSRGGEFFVKQHRVKLRTGSRAAPPR